MPIKYDNEFVKRPNEEIEYTPEQIEELYKCSQDVEYFVKYCKIIHPDYGEIKFEPFDYQWDLIKKFKRWRFNIALCSRQSGKTTVVSAYALWYAIFQEDKQIGIVSNKESSAKMILDRFKRMYEQLPAWLKPGVTEYAKTTVTFDNRTKVHISATSPDAFRGQTMNLLICDEFAFVPGGQAEEFWAANYPTVAASRKSKIIIISTPNGLFNIFHKLWVNAETNKNSFKTTKVSWQTVKDVVFEDDGTKELVARDDSWAEEQERNLGRRKFAQEFAVEFIGSTSTLIEPGVLEIILAQDKPPINMNKADSLNYRLRMWEKPQEGAIYILGCDPSKGTGEHYSAIQILKLLNMKPIEMEQVGVFHDNLTDAYDFAYIINKLSVYYNNAYILCENNGEGSVVVSRLWWDHENENLVNSGSKKKNLGIRSTGGEIKGTKPKAALLMKKLIEDGSLKLVDEKTLNELGSFIEENNKFVGKDNFDDLVCALLWGCYILEMNILDEKYQLLKKNDDDAWGILSDIDDFTEDWAWLDQSSTFSD